MPMPAAIFASFATDACALFASFDAPRCRFRAATRYARRARRYIIYMLMFYIHTCLPASRVRCYSSHVVAFTPSPHNIDHGSGIPVMRHMFIATSLHMVSPQKIVAYKSINIFVLKTIP